MGGFFNKINRKNILTIQTIIGKTSNSDNTPSSDHCSGNALETISEVSYTNARRQAHWQVHKTHSTEATFYRACLLLGLGKQSLGWTEEKLYNIKRSRRKAGTIKSPEMKVSGLFVVLLIDRCRCSY